jgi:hypothetical protein
LKAFKRLQDIQSWLSNNHNVSKVQNNTDFRFNCSTPVKKEYRTGIRTTFIMGFNAALWTLFGITFIFQISRDFHSPLISQVTGIIAGFAVGGFLGAWFTQKQLATLEKKSEIVTTLRTILYLMGAGIIIIAIILSGALNNSTAWLINGLENSIFAGGIAILDVRFILMLIWEKKKKRQIFQDRFGIYLAAQASTDNPEYQKI